MKILVTGGAGFIGSNFVHLVSKKLPEVSIEVIDALTYAGNLKNIESLKDRVKLHHLDICSQEAADLVKSGRYDAIYHFAAESHVDRSILGAKPFFVTNVLGTQNLLSALLEVNFKGRFVHVSTDEVYGSRKEGFFTEQDVLEATSPYAASKASSDLTALSFQKTFGLDVVVTRCTNNFGPYQFPEKFIPLTIINALSGKKIPVYGKGDNVRSWLHVEDHNDALLTIAEKAPSGSIVNIGPKAGSKEFTNLEVVNLILDELKVASDCIEFVTDRLAHDFRYAVDVATLKDYGYETKIGFEQGLRDTVKWYVANEAWWKEIVSGDYRNYYELNYAR